MTRLPATTAAGFGRAVRIHGKSGLSEYPSEALCRPRHKASNIQPWPYGSVLTSSGVRVRSSLRARTVPVTGAIRSLTLLTDSMSPRAWNI
jgi:hypothetical protein